MVRVWRKFKTLSKLLWFFSLLNMAATFSIFKGTEKSLNIEATTAKTAEETSSISDLIKFQTDTIRKILSASNIPSRENMNSKKISNCEDIESSIQKTLMKSDEKLEAIHPETDYNQKVGPVFIPNDIRNELPAQNLLTDTLLPIALRANERKSNESLSLGENVKSEKDSNPKTGDNQNVGSVFILNDTRSDLPVQDPTTDTQQLVGFKSNESQSNEYLAAELTSSFGPKLVRPVEPPEVQSKPAESMSIQSTSFEPILIQSKLVESMSFQPKSIPTEIQSVVEFMSGQSRSFEPMSVQSRLLDSVQPQFESMSILPKTVQFKPFDLTSIQSKPSEFMSKLSESTSTLLKSVESTPIEAKSVDSKPEANSEESTPPAEVSVERNLVPSGRTLFTLYRRNSNDLSEKDKTTSTTTSLPSVLEDQNLILVPCYKKVVNNSTRRNSDIQPDHSTTSSLPESEPQPEETSPPPLVLEKIYSSDGRFLYYMYRRANQNPEKETTTVSSTVPITTTTTTTSTTTSAPTTTTTTTTSVKEPMYVEQMKFVVRMPYEEPEPLAPYPWRFDQFAYYPREMQPDYVNAPVSYKPVYHMIRNLVVPSEHNNGGYIVAEPVNVGYENGN